MSGDAVEPAPQSPMSRPALAVAMILNRALTPEEEAVVADRTARGETSASRIAADLAAPCAAPAPWEALVFDALLGPLVPDTEEGGGDPDASA